MVSRIIKSSIHTMDGKLRHVETFRRVCCVVVRDGVTQLNVSLMFKTVKREHRIFAATERLMCCECGVYGHTRQNCPHVKKTYSTLTRAGPTVNVTENVENESRAEQEYVPEPPGTVKKGADEVHRHSINNELVPPFGVGRGVRQGCPLSGILYTLSLEPFLNTLRKYLVSLSVWELTL